MESRLEWIEKELLSKSREMDDFTRKMLNNSRSRTQSSHQDRDLEINDLVDDISPSMTKSRDVSKLKRQLSKVLQELREEEGDHRKGYGTKSQYTTRTTGLDHKPRLAHSTSDLRHDILMDSIHDSLLSKKLAETLDEKNKLQSRHEQKKEKYKLVIDKLKKRVKDEQNLSKKLQRELEVSRTKFDIQQREVESLRTNMENMYGSLKSDYASKVFDLSQGQKETSNLVNKMKVDLEATQRKLQRKEAEFELLKDELETKVRDDPLNDPEEAAEAAAIFRRMRKAIEEKESQIDSLTDEVRSYQKMGQDQLSCLNELRQVEARLYQTSGVDISLATQQKKALDTLETLTSRLQSEMSLFGTKISTISKTSASSTSDFFDIEALKLKYKRLKKKEENTQESLRNSKNLYQILQQELENKQQSLIKKQEIIDSLTQESEQKLKLQLSESKQIRSEIAELRLAIEQRDAEIKSLNGTLQVQKEQTHHFQVEAKEKAQKIEFLNERLLEKDQEIISLRKTEKQLKAKYDKSVEHYKQAIAEHQRDSERMKAELSATRDSLLESRRFQEMQKSDMVRAKAQTLDELRKQQDNMEELTQKFKGEVKVLRSQHRQEIQSLKKEKDSINKQLHQSQNDVIHLKGKVTLQEEECKALQEEITTLQGEVVAAQRTIEATKKELEVLRGEFAALEKEKKDKELIIVTLNQKLEDKHELFEHKIQSIQQLSEQEKNNQERKTEMIMTDLKKSLVENEAISRKLANLEEKHNQLVNENKQLESVIMKKDEQITDALRKISYLEEANEQQKVNIRDLLMEKEDIHNKLHFKDLNVKELESRIESMEDDLQTTHSIHIREKDHQSSQIVSLEEMIHSKSKEIEDLKSRISQLDDNLQYKKMENEALSKERNALKAKYEELIATYNKLENEKMRIELKLDSVSNDNNLLGARYDEVTRSLEKTSRALNELEEQHTKLQHELQVVTAERGLLQQRYTEDIDAKNQTISQHLMEIEEHENNIRIAEERIRKLTSELQQREVQSELDTSQRIQLHERLSQNLSAKLDEIGELNSQLIDARQKIAELQDLNQRYQIEIIQVQKTSRSSKQKLQTFVRQLKLQIRTLSYAMSETRIIAENELKTLRNEMESKSLTITQHIKNGVSNPEVAAENTDLKMRLQQLNEERRRDIDLHRRKLKMLNDQIAELRQSLVEKTQECQRLEDIFQNNLVKDIKTLSNSVNLSEDYNS